jgi:hypothetical protein
MTDGCVDGCASFDGMPDDETDVLSFVVVSVDRQLIESLAFDRMGSDLIVAVVVVAVVLAANHWLTGPTLASESKRSDFSLNQTYVLATPLLDRRHHHQYHHWSGFEIVVFVVTAVEYRFVMPVLSVAVCAALLLLKNQMKKH